MGDSKSISYLEACLTCLHLLLPTPKASVTARPLQEHPWGFLKAGQLVPFTLHPKQPLGLEENRVLHTPTPILELCSQANKLALAKHTVSVKCFSSVACRYNASVVRVQPT